MTKSLILVHTKTRMQKQRDQVTMQKWYKENGEKQRRRMRKWYRGNHQWYEQYRKDNPERIREAFDRYRLSPLGMETIKRYEQSPRRKAGKAYWNFLKNLKDQVEEGRITKKEMEIRIKHRKLVDRRLMTLKEMRRRRSLRFNKKKKQQKGRKRKRYSLPLGNREWRKRY